MIILIEKKEYFLKELDNKVILSWKNNMEIINDI
jgi:hypothetical protein